MFSRLVVCQLQWQKVIDLALCTQITTDSETGCSKAEGARRWYSRMLVSTSEQMYVWEVERQST
jgi:hypothetical protein